MNIIFYQILLLFIFRIFTTKTTFGETFSIKVFLTRIKVTILICPKFKTNDVQYETGIVRTYFLLSNPNTTVRSYSHHHDRSQHRETLFQASVSLKM